MDKVSPDSPIDNIRVDRDKNYILIKVNPKIYSLEIVYYAAYVFIERAYVLIDGDPEKEILVELRPKQKEDMDILGIEFNNELLSYAVYLSQAEKNKSLREALLQRVLMTNTQTESGNDE